MTIRIGLDALIEHFATTDILKKQLTSLKNIACSSNTRLQIDALHYIALIGDEKNKGFLQEKTRHEDAQVKNAAIEALETLKDLIN